MIQPHSLPTRLLLAAAVFGCTAPRAERPQAFHESVQQLIAHDDSSLIIENVRVIDGTGSPAREGQSIRIENGRIVAIGDGLAPKNAKKIEGNGRTLIPGLIMFHEHLLYPNRTVEVPNYTSESLAMTPLYLAGGATTIRTGGTMDAHHDLRVRDLVRAGRWAGPDIHITAPFLEGPGSFSYQMHPQDNEQAAREFVRYWVDVGATSFKAYMNVSKAVLGAAIDEAHKRGAMVTGHLCSVTFQEASELGIDNLEHGLVVATDLHNDKPADRCPERMSPADRIEMMRIDRPEIQRIIKRLVDRNVAVTSTLPVFAAGAHPAIPTQQSLNLLSPRSKAAMQEIWIRALRSPDSEAVLTQKQLLAREMEFEKAFVDAGGTLLVGTDPTGWGGTIPPNSIHAALILLVEAGFSPLAVIHLATLNGATFLGIDQDVGSIEVGKRANLVLIDGRPDESIDHVQHVALVFKDGVAYRPEALVDSVRGTLGR